MPLLPLAMSLGLPIFKPANPINQERKAAPIRVLLVEDDEDYREIVSSELEWHGFAVRSFADGTSLLGALDTVTDADIIVLDWRLPNISGIDLLPLLRQRGVNFPVVFLTSHPQLDNESQAFARGAIDFIDKMRGVEILVRRLRLVAGRPAATPCPEKPIVCGKLVLNPNASRASWNEVDVGLTVGEYDIVHLLASNVGDYKSYRAIYDLQYYEGFVAGKGLKDIGQTFDHLLSASAASSARLIRPSAKSRIRRSADIAGEV